MPRLEKEHGIVPSPEAKKEPEDDGNLSEVDDEEIEAMLLSPAEVQRKTVVWYTANKEYLAEMEARARKIEMDKRNGVYKGHVRKK